MYVLILTRMGWATFWAIFSQTHLVTLVAAAACSFEDFFPRLDAVVLFGEPTRWETSLQLIIDVLLTDGKPSRQPKFVPRPHLPVLVNPARFSWTQSYQTRF
jgi:hypothetical protein